MIEPFGRQVLSVTLRQHCPQMIQRRCMRARQPGVDYHWVSHTMDLHCTSQYSLFHPAPRSCDHILPSSPGVVCSNVPNHRCEEKGRSELVPLSVSRFSLYPTKRNIALAAAQENLRISHLDLKINMRIFDFFVHITHRSLLLIFR